MLDTGFKKKKKDIRDFACMNLNAIVSDTVSASSVRLKLCIPRLFLN